MRKSWLIALLVLPALVFGLTPANAAGTSIRTTTQYAKLKAYVNVLENKKSQPQNPAEISQYRATLKDKKGNASNKVRALYQADIRKAQATRDNQRARVVNLKQKKKAQLAQLRRDKAAALNTIAANRRAALARIDNQYDAKIGGAQKKLKKLNRKLNKATNPLKRQTLREQINAVQDQINAWQQSKNNDIDTANKSYNQKQNMAQRKWDNRIESTDTRFTNQITTLKEALQERYQAAKQASQDRRAENFADVKEQYALGVQYIQEMTQNG